MCGDVSEGSVCDEVHDGERSLGRILRPLSSRQERRCDPPGFLSSSALALCSCSCRHLGGLLALVLVQLGDSATSTLTLLCAATSVRALGRRLSAAFNVHVFRPSFFL